MLDHYLQYLRLLHLNAILKFLQLIFLAHHIRTQYLKQTGQLYAQSSGESSGSEKPSPEDNYSENDSEKQSSTAESTGSDYESGSSFEEAKRKKAKRKTRGSATCKAAAAGRKQQFQRTKARAFLSSPQSVYLVGKAATSPAQKKKSAAAAKKRKSNESPTESEASSASNESESNRSAPTTKKKQGP